MHASPDGSAAVAPCWRPDSRIRAIAHQENLGHIATYNEGLAEVTGKYVVLLSADDLLAPGSLARAAALMGRSRQSASCTGKHRPARAAPLTSVNGGHGGGPYGAVSDGCGDVPHGAQPDREPRAVMRTSVLNEIGAYDPELPHSADLDLWMRAALVADVGRVNGPAQGYYRGHGANMRLTDYAGVLTDMQQRARGFDLFFRGPGRRLRNADTLRGAALRSIAREALRIARLPSEAGSDDAQRERLAEFAKECWPPIDRTLTGRAYRMRDRGPAVDARRALARARARTALAGAVPAVDSTWVVTVEMNDAPADRSAADRGATPNISEGKPFRIAYYLAAHHKPRQFAWLFSSIYTEQDLFLVHVDKKASPADYEAITKIVGGGPNIVLLPRRTENWGGWSQVGAEMAALKVALGDSGDWDYFINLSGHDYPIKSPQDIRSTLARAYPQNFIRAWSFDKVRGTEPDDPHLRREMALEIGRHTRKLGVGLPGGAKYLQFKGSQWHMLTREFCEWLANDKVPRRIARRLRFTHCPDETYFQAAIMTSPFADRRAPDCGRFFEFPGPRTLVLDDLQQLLEVDDLFARKFDEDVDGEILRQLAERLGLASPPA